MKKEMVALFSSALLLLLFVRLASGVLFSSLPQTLAVSASIEHGRVLQAGKDKLAVSWRLNQSLPASTDEEYKTARAVLCYTAASQAGREWRTAADELSKDKACQFSITAQPYLKGEITSFEWAISPDFPSATYFVRVLALDSGGVEVAYGQTTDSGELGSVLSVAGVSGRQPWMGVAVASYSALLAVALVALAVAERRKVSKQRASSRYREERRS